jgi:hypothetical protein
VRSDSDPDEDDQSSVDSETDSETELASEGVPHDGHPTLLSPGTTHRSEPNRGDSVSVLSHIRCSWLNAPQRSSQKVTGGKARWKLFSKDWID